MLFLRYRNRYCNYNYRKSLLHGWRKLSDGQGSTGAELSPSLGQSDPCYLRYKYKKCRKKFPRLFQFAKKNILAIGMMSGSQL